MNIENLNQEELKQLQVLLNKMNPQSQPEVDPVNQMIDEILDKFDFAKVQNTMDYLGWKWVDRYVTIEMLREEAEQLLKHAADSRLNLYKDKHWELGVTYSAGGFRVTAFCNEDKTKITRLDLKFILTEWDTEIED